MTEKESCIRYIKRSDEGYPELLNMIEDPPEGLYLIGKKELLQSRCIAVVGSRRCSEYGKKAAMKIAGTAVKNGFTVVSGMAIGIDNFAHQGALKCGGNTIAVLGTGADICYPPQHMGIYEDICSYGLVISEYEPGTKAMPYRFPMRNRIIAGISEAVVVVEARQGSGSLITAEYADSQNKPVFAVPGNITSQYSLGTNRLIADGAQIVASVDDIFCQLGVRPEIDEEEVLMLSETERKVYEYIKHEGEVFPDRICSELGMDPFQVSSMISGLEIKGLITFSMGRVMTMSFRG